ncbi:14132_t:CDS:2, partial [Entrophospora sp. SA101]
TTRRLSDASSVASSLSGKGEFDEVIKDLRSGLKRTRNRPISKVFTELEVIPPSRPVSKIILDDDNEIDVTDINNGNNNNHDQFQEYF